MKKLLVLIAMVGLSVSAMAQSAVLSTNISNGAGYHLISTNRLKVYSIEVTTTNAYNFRFWDNDNTLHTTNVTGFWGTNFINGSYISRSTYPTTYVNSYVGYNGYTNWYTNAGIWSVTVTNTQATNPVAPLFTIATSGAETRVNYVDAIFTRGMLVQSTGNGAITVYYRVDQ